MIQSYILLEPVAKLSKRICDEYIIGVYLNKKDSVPVLSTSADSRGDLVVKCDILHIKEMVTEGPTTFRLNVYTEDGV